MAQSEKATATMPPTATPLVGKGRQGDFVHNTQQMAAEEGFRNVSRLWLNKCKTYDETIGKVEENRTNIEDFTLPLGAIKPDIDDANNFVMNIEGVPYRPTEYALGQIAGWAGVGQYAVEVLAGTHPDSNGRERNRPKDRAALLDLLDSGFSLIDPKKQFLLRTQKDGTFRAMLSDKYEIMDNLWFLEVIRDIIPGGMFSHWRDDGDFSTLWGNILIPDSIRAESDSEYGAMFSIGNSEIGRRRLNATPSLFRAICMNGCIWDQAKGSKFNQIHRGKIDLMALKMQLRKHLTDQIPLINTAIDTLLGTRAIGWDGASTMPVFAALGKNFTLPKLTNSAILESYRDQAHDEDGFRNDESLRKSAFGVINAVTRSANDTKEPAEWVRRDTLGGTLLGWSKDDWSHLFRRANTMKAEDVSNAFAGAN